MTLFCTVVSVPAEIESFLQEHHVLSLSTADADGRPYAASVYYAYLSSAGDAEPEPGGPALVILSDRKTRHGTEMLAQPQLAGTIHVEPPPDREGVAQIRGVQFIATAELLDDAHPATTGYREAYYERFDYARAQKSDAWLLRVTWMKMTDNSVRFGYKRIWPEADPDSGEAPA